MKEMVKGARERVKEGETNREKAVKKTVNCPQLNSLSRCNKLQFFYVRKSGRTARTLEEKDRERFFFKDAITTITDAVVFTRGSRKQWDNKRRNQTE